MVFGAYDRDVEDQQIKAQPPAAVGNPGKTSILEQLTAKFAGYDDDHTTTLNAYTKSGARVWLEFDVDVTEDDLREYRKAGTNRAARRAGTAPEDIAKAPVAARTLSDRNTRVWFTDPDTKGSEPLQDTEGDPLTVHSEEWLASIKREDPVDGLRALFGDVKVLVLYQEFLDAAAHIGDPQGVDPTRGASGD